jgi:hypothetical protein
MGMTEVRYLLQRWRASSNFLFGPQAASKAKPPAPPPAPADPAAPAKLAKERPEPPPPA